MTPTGIDHIFYTDRCDLDRLGPAVLAAVQEVWPEPLLCINGKPSSVRVDWAELAPPCEILFVRDAAMLRKFEEFGYEDRYGPSGPALVAVGELKDVTFAGRSLEGMLHSTSDGVPSGAHAASFWMRRLVVITVVTCVEKEKSPLAAGILKAVAAALSH